MFVVSYQSPTRARQVAGRRRIDAETKATAGWPRSRIEDTDCWNELRYRETD